MRRLTGLAVLLTILCMGAWALSENDVAGVWTVPDGKTRVEIYKNAQGAFEGKIVWMDEPNFSANDPDAGKPKCDRENPDPALRDRPIMGLVILKDCKFNGKDEWSGGTVYDPNCGKTYKGKLWLNSPDSLGMRGFIGISLLGRSETWTRYTEPKK